MQADLSRLIFRPDKRFSAVLAQQGRVQLDSDSNEQVLIQRHQDRTIAADLIGRHGGPSGDLGFGITFVPKGKAPADLTITAGRYYVDGILVDAAPPAPGIPVEEEPDPGTDAVPESPTGWTYWNQPDAYRDPERANDVDHLPDVPFLAYLKVTEQLVTFLQDPEIRETALGVALPDTTARIKVTWQVLPLAGLEVGARPTRASVRAAFDEWAASAGSTARLAARTERPAKVADDPCLTAPDSRYRGPENQLYRVEVQHGGKLSDKPTFKWSRENASVVFGISSIAKSVVTLTDQGRDGKLDLDVGDWVEIADDAYLARGIPAPLLQVTDIDTERLRVELSGEPQPEVGGLDTRHPFLRRWDHRAPSGRGAAKLIDGALPISEGGWLDLEDGLQVWFAPGGEYRAGDYWLLAARTLRGDVEWPRDLRGRPLLREPLGVRHHYAPLAWIRGETIDDLRMEFTPLAVARP
jgi:hypothetical protein